MRDDWRSIYMNRTVYGDIGFGVFTIKCPNSECEQLFLRVRLTKSKTGPLEGNDIQVWQLLPESTAKILPEYIPEAIQRSYKQACRIRDLSPEASATLARRTLQGMIRDFWGVTKPSLKQEIDAIQDKVDPDTWTSIEAVRSIGNIGAHMEGDINLIIEIEPDEAQLLIGLVESLVDDWYVTREKRKERNAKIATLAEEKKAAKKVSSEETK